MQKFSSFHRFILEIQLISEPCKQADHTYFWPCPPKMFLIYTNLCQHSKGFFIDKWLIKKSCNLTGWEHFGPYLRNEIFPNIWDSCRSTANNINSCYKANSVKVDDQSFQKIKRPVFGPYLVNFPNFGGKLNFSRKSTFVTLKFIWVFSTMPIFRKS